MLRTLTIQDFVIVDHVELEFQSGFTVLTGETGAGKSILIDALALILGERADVNVVRNECARAELTAHFDVAGSLPAQQWLTENDLEAEAHDCILRRVIESSGRSRGFINGRPATLNQLRELGDMLVDIHGQQAHLSLLKADVQRALLDGYAGLTDLAAQVAQAFKVWSGVKKLRIASENNAQESALETERLQWQHDELLALSFELSEWEATQADHARLAHAAALLEGASYGLEMLSESEEACLSRLNRVLTRLHGLLEHDIALKETCDLLQSAQIQLTEAIYGLRHYQKQVDIDPQRLEAIEQRLQAIHSAARKYRVRPEEIPGLLESLRSRIAQFAEVSIDELLRQEHEALRAYHHLADALSLQRTKAAEDLGAKVTKELAQLAMPQGRFDVVLTRMPEGASYGMENVEFFVSAHAGLPLRPLARVASGGELSRISLAIQAATAAVGTKPTLIFDEVDVGIGGRVAQIVGGMLKHLGRKRQVLCVTHLPQVAACGDQQWQVSKLPVNGLPATQIVLLDAERRVEEIARMLGGMKITNTTRQHARELLHAGND